jgi:hypothetical protein
MGNHPPTGHSLSSNDHFVVFELSVVGLHHEAGQRPVRKFLEQGRGKIRGKTFLAGVPCKNPSGANALASIPAFASTPSKFNVWLFARTNLSRKILASGQSPRKPASMVAASSGDSAA